MPERRGPLANSFRKKPEMVPDYDLDPGMATQPFCVILDVVILLDIDLGARFDIDDSGSLCLRLSPARIVNADDFFEEVPSFRTDLQRF